MEQISFKQDCMKICAETEEKEGIKNNRLIKSTIKTLELLLLIHRLLVNK
jgi:hypothetical protein